jgi:tetratricopeptide (TPR) repeat protein
MELDSGGGFRDLDALSWRQRREQLKELPAQSKPPDPCAVPPERFLAWHLQEADDAEAAGESFGAVWHLDRLIKLESTRWEHHARRGGVYVGWGRYKEAITDCSTAIQLGAKDWQVWLNRGRAYAGLKQWDKAAEDFSEVIKLAPDRWAGWMLRAQVYAALLQWDKAVEDYSVALDRGVGEWQVWPIRAWGYAELGQWKKAASDYAQATSLDANEDTWYRRALVQLGNGDASGYRQTCQAMLARYGRDAGPDTANTLSWTCALAPDAVADGKAAKQLAESAVAGAPKESAYVGTLGAALYRAGQYREAVRRLNEAIALQGKGGAAQDWLFLAMAHHRLGHAAEAKKWLGKAAQEIDQAVRDDPKNTAAALPWNQRLELRILRREAEKVLKGPEP